VETWCLDTDPNTELCRKSAQNPSEHGNPLEAQDPS
jgi:hypothetical protein